MDSGSDDVFLAAFGAANDAHARALEAYRRDPSVRKLQLIAYVNGAVHCALWVLASIGLMHLGEGADPSLATKNGLLLGVVALGLLAGVRLAGGGRLLPDVAADKAAVIRESLMHAAHLQVQGRAFEVIRRARHDDSPDGGAQ